MDLFKYPGVHCVVDGQFGSTGKGALSAYLSFQAGNRNRRFEGAISNGGPNSGHTFYHNDEKIVLKQLPTFSVAQLLQHDEIVPAYLSAGAIIDPDILFAEARRYPRLPIYVHPNAAVIWDVDKGAEHSGSVAAVAGTRSGTGVALSNKVLRMESAIWGNFHHIDIPPNVTTLNHKLHPERELYFMEVSQGFSLGINSHFYPKVTSRECTVMQGLSDARIAPRHLRKTYMSVRTFPIRVGNVDGFSSGDWYSDQEEIQWSDLGVLPELTTVTQRVRRVATFSRIQFEESLATNAPDFVFINFLNYLKGRDQDDFLEEIHEYADDYGFVVLEGYGPLVTDVRPSS